MGSSEEEMKNARATFMGLKLVSPIFDADIYVDTKSPEPRRIIDRTDEYRKRRLNKHVSPERTTGKNTLDPAVRTYDDIMREEALKRENEKI
ncbi:splicing factor 3B subunit, putative [Medicago truncatula]|uniref:Splicing factor 3B subunit, putative n=1 Tax=Medicago truncatula TaxID=3880 RepID=G7IPK0_MEDTR|nr:splicing factor 3B subunit, putative [Medicago truncatula]